LQRMQQSFFQSVHTGDIMARATNDLSSVRAFLRPGISNSVRTILMFVIASALMIGINIKLAVIFVFFMPMVSISFVVIGRQMQNRWERVQAQFGNLSTYAQENFSGIRVVKAYAQEEYEVQHFAKANADYVRRSLAYQRLNQLLWPMMTLVLGLAGAAVLFVGGTEVINGGLSLGQFVQFNGYLWMLSWPMIALGWVVSLYQRGTASMTRINAIMRRAPAIASDPRARPVATLRGEITFDDVSLAYGDRPVLEHVSFHVP